MKTVYVKIAGSEREGMEIRIKPGTTAGDVLRDLNLTERGWRKTGSFPSQEYLGYYRCPYGSWKGRVLASTSSPRYYLYKPPEALKLKHPHSACFSSQGDGWFSVHFRTIPRDIDSGVIAIERILTECMRLK